MLTFNFPLVTLCCIYWEVDKHWMARWCCPSPWPSEGRSVPFVTSQLANSQHHYSTHFLKVERATEGKDGLFSCHGNLVTNAVGKLWKKSLLQVIEWVQIQPDFTITSFVSDFPSSDRLRRNTSSWATRQLAPRLPVWSSPVWKQPPGTSSACAPARLLDTAPTLQNTSTRPPETVRFSSSLPRSVSFQEMHVFVPSA